jgi:hypothetical protein
MAMFVRIAVVLACLLCAPVPVFAQAGSITLISLEVDGNVNDFYSPGSFIFGEATGTCSLPGNSDELPFRMHVQIQDSGTALVAWSYGYAEPTPGGGAVAIGGNVGFNVPTVSPDTMYIFHAELAVFNPTTVMYDTILDTDEDFWHLD